MNEEKKFFSRREWIGLVSHQLSSAAALKYLTANGFLLSALFSSSRAEALWGGVAWRKARTASGAVSCGAYVSWAFTAQASGNYPYLIVGSSDFVKLARGEASAGLDFSANGGTSWTAVTAQPPINYTSHGILAVTPDFTKILDTGTGNYIFRSADSGVTWTQLTTAGARSWRTLAMSSDGTKITASGVSIMYTSSDSGTSWTSRGNYGDIMKVVMSSDGTKQAAITQGVGTGVLRTSADSGASWSTQAGAGTRNWRTLTMSSDGTRLAASVTGGYIYVSADSGVTWTERTALGTGTWYLAASSDGLAMLAACNASYLYTSIDAFASWMVHTSAGARPWIGAAMSSDGLKLAATTLNNGWTYFGTGTCTAAPTSDIWAVMATSPAASRHVFSTVWTGSKMIIWGGGTAPLRNDGFLYDPSSDSWSATDTASAPQARCNHSAVWTGSKMIIWGGYIGGVTNTGGVYDPATNTWTATSTSGAPNAREQHVAFWTGSKMIIWGGDNTGGALYDPASDTWSAMSNTNSGNTYLYGGVAVWTGSKMIVWGEGRTAPYSNVGKIYDPSNNTWTSMSTTGAPAARTSHCGIWTGSKLIVWGGTISTGYDPYYGTYSTAHTNTGGIYDPSTNTWTSMSTTNAPAARSTSGAVWTGSKMVIWGGYSGSLYNSGGVYDPATDTWTSTTLNTAPAARTSGAYVSGTWAVWSGSKMLVWGGSYLTTGGLYTP